jgi:carboxymethylenebutenolidase
MRLTLPLALALVAVSAAAFAQSPAPAPPTAVAAVRNAALPPSETQATEQLNTTPRHGELVPVPITGEETKLRTWIVYPEVKDKAGVVILVHEIFGLSDWIRGVADQLAREGFIAVVPDLISGYGPGGGGTESAGSRDSVVQLVLALSPAETTKRLDAVRDWATRQPAANGRFATMGFCWGGGKSFAYAAAKPAPRGAIVFYGVSPDSATLQDVQAPVLAFYGGDDARVTSTIEPAKARLAKLGRKYEPHVYDGAGHGFLRQQDGRDGANMRATQQAWPRALAFLRERLK